MAENQPLLALLIDGENAQPSLIPHILEAVGKYGKISIPDVYGDFSRDQLKSWESVAKEYRLRIKPYYNVSKNKNATDIALVIAAMDYLYKGKVNGFCIVSSDRDFTHLANRIREEGLFTIGVGRNDEALKDAYDAFITLEELIHQGSVTQASVTQSPPNPTTVESLTEDEFLNLLLEAAEQTRLENMPNDGWLTLSEIKKKILTLNSSISINTKSLAQRTKALAEAKPYLLQVDERLDMKPVQHYVRVLQAIDILQEAYLQAEQDLKRKDEGWVLLSTMGTLLREIYKEDLNYKGAKQLKKVVEKMREDYPDRIELRSDGLTTYIRLYDGSTFKLK